jgi:membrane protein required for colicin V production
MNVLDFFILVPIAYFGYRGFLNGFIKEFFGIAGIIIAVFVAFRYMGPVSGFLTPFVKNADNATLVTGILIFILVMAVTQVAAYWLEEAFNIIRLGFINQAAGLIFGAAKSAIVVSAVLLLLSGFNIPQETTRSESATYPSVIYLAPMAYNMIASVYPGTENFINTIEKSIRENNTLRTLPIFDKNEPDS